jgi:hypothetical protein
MRGNVLGRGNFLYSSSLAAAAPEVLERRRWISWEGLSGGAGDGTNTNNIVGGSSCVCGGALLFLGEFSKIYKTRYAKVTVFCRKKV